MNYDDLLHIKTTEENHQFPTVTHYHRYEPTTYSDLLALSNYLKPMIQEDELLVDFGSGLMRVPIFMNYQLQINTLGIELNKALYLDGLKNVDSYRQQLNSSGDIQALNMNVTDYHFNGRESILFFFNPFSAEIFKTVLSHLISQASYKRRIIVILYYAKVEYIDAIHQSGQFTEIKSILLSRYPTDQNDVIVIYQLD
ncbi:hypothetical protein [Macrococcus lamae]|nr:hypothetical protein [Macrococcus lamae]